MQFNSSDFCSDTLLLLFLGMFQVGTVLYRVDAKYAIKSGAKFLMSPVMVKVQMMKLDDIISIEENLL